MKFTLSWLREHLETDDSLERLTETLSSIGLEVDAVENRGAALAPFRTARILEATPHPNADRLRVCRVDIGGAEVGVVCGAPNARTGLHVVFAPPGAFIPGSGITLKTGEIRGVVSAGMLLSTREMGLGEEHDGIAELPDGAPVGQSYAAWAGLDDPVIEIGVTPNRGDALAIRGIARDLAAAGLGRLKPWEPAAILGSFASPIGWAIDWPEACPFVIGRTIRGVRNGPSPAWLQRRLTSIGLRPISALVDVTNLFTFDLGRPLHVFDADRIDGAILTLRAGDGETFRTLNDRDIVVGPSDLVIADKSSVTSLAGIMGGKASGTSDGTRNVFIECALFDPVQIALSGRRHQISSDARQRFERGVDPSLLPRALDAATQMILDICGGEASSVVSAGSEPAWQRTASLRYERLAGLGGADMLPDAAANILRRLGFDTVENDAIRLTVAVPPWRNDIAGLAGLDQMPELAPDRAAGAAEGAVAMEPECDLLEEILRIAGLDAIPPVSLPRADGVQAPALTPRQQRTGLVRRVLAARQMRECVTYSFVDRTIATAFGDTPDGLTLKNPIAADLDQMRPSPLATLVSAAARNAARGATDISLFEVGPAFSADGQSLVAAGVRAGKAPRHWQGGPELADPMAAKADLFAVLTALNVPMESLSVTTDAPAHYHPGRSGVVRQGPKMVLGQFGALHPSLCERLGLDLPASAFEIFLDAIPDPKRRKRAPPDLPPFQPVRRDFAFVVKQDVTAEAVLRAARGADRALISHVGLFDVYDGSNMTAGTKSLGIEIVFQPRTQTLTEAEIDAACKKAVDAVARATGAQLR